MYIYLFSFNLNLISLNNPYVFISHLRRKLKLEQCQKIAETGVQVKWLHFYQPVQNCGPGMDLAIAVLKHVVKLENAFIAQFNVAVK